MLLTLLKKHRTIITEKKRIIKKHMTMFRITNTRLMEQMISLEKQATPLMKKLTFLWRIITLTERMQKM